jgi:hypothetical protein
MTEKRTPPPCPACGEVPKWDEFDWWLKDYGEFDPPHCGYEGDECYEKWNTWENHENLEDEYDRLREAFEAGSRT